MEPQRHRRSLLSAIRASLMIFMCNLLWSSSVRAAQKAREGTRNQFLRSPVSWLRPVTGDPLKSPRAAGSYRFERRSATTDHRQNFSHRSMIVFREVYFDPWVTRGVDYMKRTPG